MKNCIKKNIKVIVAFVLGLIVSGTGVYAATIMFDSDQVGYDNTNTNLQINNVDIDNVQDAIDAIYTKTTGLQTQLTTAQANEFLTKYKTMSGTPQHYAWNERPGPSSTGKGNHNVYVAKWGDSQIGVCIYRSGIEYCFRYNNWLGEQEHLKEVFGENSCEEQFITYMYCDDSDFHCEVLENGNVTCDDKATGENCTITGSTVTCS